METGGDGDPDGALVETIMRRSSSLENVLENTPANDSILIKPGKLRLCTDTAAGQLILENTTVAVMEMDKKIVTVMMEDDNKENLNAEAIAEPSRYVAAPVAEQPCPKKFMDLTDMMAELQNIMSEGLLEPQKTNGNVALETTEEVPTRAKSETLDLDVFMAAPRNRRLMYTMKWLVAYDFVPDTSPGPASHPRKRTSSLCLAMQSGPGSEPVGSEDLSAKRRRNDFPESDNKKLFWIPPAVKTEPCNATAATSGSSKSVIQTPPSAQPALTTTEASTVVHDAALTSAIPVGPVVPADGSEDDSDDGSADDSDDDSSLTSSMSSIIGSCLSSLPISGSSSDCCCVG